MKKRAGQLRGDSQPIPEGLVSRIASGLRYMATGKKSDAWFGPLEPLEPLAPPEVAGRQFDYPSGYNVVTQPRAFDGIDFHQLRALADSYDVMRLVIETRKDQLAGLQWEIKPRDEKKTSTNDPRIKEVTDFLAYPDRQLSWDQWLRALAEDMLVIDAATIYPRRTKGGQLYALELIDGSTIKRVLDDWGRTPVPPDPAYQQVLKGLPAVDYTTDDVIYLPRNIRTNRIYGYSPVEQVIMSVNIAMRRQVHQLNYFTEGNVPEALIGVPVNWSVNQIREFQEYWDALLEGNLAQRRHARFVPGEIAKQYIATKEPGLKDEYDEWLTRIICYAFSVSAQWAIKQMNRSTAEAAQEQALQEGLGPLKVWVKGMVDRVLAQGFGYADLELGWHEEEAVDPQVQATVADTYLRNGTYCLNEVRAQLGQPPIPGGDVHRIYTPGGAVPLDQVDKPPTPPARLGHNGGPPLEEDDDAGDDDEDGDEEEEPERGSAFGKQAPFKPIDRRRPAIAALESRLKGIWEPFLARQGDAVAARLAGTFGKLAKAAGDGDPDQAEPGKAPAKTSGSAIDDAIDAAIAETSAETIEGETADLLIEAAIDGVAEGLVAIGHDSDAMVSLANPRAVAQAAARAADLVTGIDETTRTALRDAITKAEQRGASVDELAQEIRQLGAFSAKRAALIAQHELAKADIAGNLAGWRTARDELGIILLKRWILGLDENHCETCLGNVADGAIPLDEPFSSGDQAAPAHPHCECDLVPETAAAEKLAKTFKPDQPRDGRGRWTSGGAAASSKAVEIERGRANVRDAIHRQGDMHNAFTVPEVGPVALVWGHPGEGAAHKGGYGLAKIVAKHGEEMAHRVPEIALKGKIAPGGVSRTIIQHGEHHLVLTRGGNGPKSPWVLTAYRKSGN